MDGEKSEAKPLFRDINADDDDPEVMEIESFCVGCEGQGITRLFLTKIPFFREVIVSSFSCDLCGLRNTELQPGGKIQDKGVRYKTNIKNAKDMNRQVVQTDSCTVSIPKLDFEVPPNKGVLTTVEGIIDKSVEGLMQDQVLRKIQHPEIAAQIEAFVEKLNGLRELKEPFELCLDDPSGNSFVENLHAPQVDPDMTIHYYKRTKDQDEMLGIFENEESQEEPEQKKEEEVQNKQEEGKNKQEEVKNKQEQGKNKQEEKDEQELFTGMDEVMSFQTNCPSCNTPCETHMKMVSIPYFKEVLIISTTCDACGHCDREVKGGSGIEPKGTKIDFHVTDVSDMSRDILKSETCSLSVPELKLELGMGTLGGKFTTLEGLFTSIRDDLQKKNPFIFGDSSNNQTKEKMKAFCGVLDKVISGEMLDYHVILDDPAGNSYLQNVYAPESDPEMEITHYERSYEQNEDLGLNDMKTEDYDES